jgi:hypothetical protein
MNHSCERHRFPLAELRIEGLAGSVLDSNQKNTTMRRRIQVEPVVRVAKHGYIVTRPVG